MNSNGEIKMCKGFCLLVMLTATSTVFGQPVVQRISSTCSIEMNLECEDSSASSDPVWGYGNTEQEAENDAKAKLYPLITPGFCEDGEDPLYTVVTEVDCDGGGGEGERSVARSRSKRCSNWTVRVAVTFGNGERMAFNGYGCNQCQARQNAWAKVCRRCGRKCGVCNCTQNWRVVRQPCCQSSCCQSSCCQSQCCQSSGNIQRGVHRRRLRRR